MLRSGAARWMRKHVDDLLKSQGVYWREEAVSGKDRVGVGSQAQVLEPGGVGDTD